MSDDQGERIRQTRERELNRKSVGVLSSPFDAAVVGVVFVDGYPNNLYQLEALNFEAENVGERLAAVIVRNPDNPFDYNACEVHVPSLGDDGMIGYLPRPVAARLAAELDAGVEWQGEVAAIRISNDNPANPGITIHLSRRRWNVSGSMQDHGRDGG